MKVEKFYELKQGIIDAGYGDEIVWQESIQPCDDAFEFFKQYMWVVLCAGMKEQVARKIERRIFDAWSKGQSTSDAFGHVGKVTAIDVVRNDRVMLFAEWCQLGRNVYWLLGLPWIGKITMYHLAKNLGVDVAKPDRHLTRVANTYGLQFDVMCKKLAHETGLRIATVDLVIWRAANLKLV